MKHSLDHRGFIQLFSSYKSLSAGDLLFRHHLGNKSKLGFIVSRKYGNAVNRNLLKRRCRALFKEHFKSNNIVLVIQPKKSSISWSNLSGWFSELKKNNNV